MRIRIENLEKRCDVMKKEMEEAKKKFEKKSWSDNLAFARDREDLDFLSNQKKENKLHCTKTSKNEREIIQWRLLMHSSHNCHFSN